MITTTTTTTTAATTTTDNALTKVSMTARQAAASPAEAAATASATAAENTARLSPREGLLYSISSCRDRAATCRRSMDRSVHHRQDCHHR